MAVSKLDWRKPALMPCPSNVNKNETSDGILAFRPVIRTYLPSMGIARNVGGEQRGSSSEMVFEEGEAA